jgi:hypothetical protein
MPSGTPRARLPYSPASLLLSVYHTDKFRVRKSFQRFWPTAICGIRPHTNFAAADLQAMVAALVIIQPMREFWSASWTHSGQLSWRAPKVHVLSVMPARLAVPSRPWRSSPRRFSPNCGEPRRIGRRLHPPPRLPHPAPPRAVASEIES